MDPKVNQRLFIGVCVLLVVLVGIFTYDYLIKSKNSEDVKSSRLFNDIKYNLDVYRDSEGVMCLVENEKCKDKYMAISVDNEFAKLLDITEDGSYILFDDNGLKLYDVKNNSRTNIDLNGYDKYTIGYDSIKDKVVGLVYYKDKKVDEGTGLEGYKTIGFYNTQTKMKLYEGIYGTLNVLNEKYLEGSLVVDASLEDGMEVHLLSTTEDKTLSTVKGMCEQYGIVEAGSGYFVKEQSGCLADTAISLYTDNLDFIGEGIENHAWSVDEAGNLYLLNGNRVSKYDLTGQAVGTSNSYSNVKQVIRNYIIYVYNGMLKITNEDDVNLDVAQWNMNYDYDGLTSGYRGKDYGVDFDQVGIYINFYAGDNHVSYYFNEETKEVVQVNENE